MFTNKKYLMVANLPIVKSLHSRSPKYLYYNLCIKKNQRISMDNFSTDKDKGIGLMSPTKEF